MLKDEVKQVEEIARRIAKEEIALAVKPPAAVKPEPGEKKPVIAKKLGGKR